MASDFSVDQKKKKPILFFKFHMMHLKHLCLEPARNVVKQTKKLLFCSLFLNYASLHVEELF